MGCNASKAANDAVVAQSPKGKSPKQPTPRHTPQQQQQQNATAEPSPSSTKATARTNRSSSKQEAAVLGSASMTTAGTTNSRKSLLRKRSKEENDESIVYRLLAKVQRGFSTESDSVRTTESSSLNADIQAKIIAACTAHPVVARYQNPTTQSTPLHMAVRLMDFPQRNNKDVSLPDILQALIRANPDAVRVKDATGHIPLHYAMASSRMDELPAMEWKLRAEVLQILLAADIETSIEYLQQDSVTFEGPLGTEGTVESTDCTPFYRALQALPDDFERESPTVLFCAVLKEASSAAVTMPNRSDGDTPLALLYRRFTRQFDLAEKFFAGDNSRPEVVQHRKRYKTAAGNTWKIIECLLRPELNSNHPAQWRLLHRAVQIETPPDLLRYIVETNAEDLQQTDGAGNLPLHYAANINSPSVYYSKFVTDELLYKFPESASVPDGQGLLPLQLAISSKKAWIAGGLQSLYDAYPAAMKHIDLSRHTHLHKIFSMDSGDNDNRSPPVSPEEKKIDSSVKDEPHDAIMLVQQSTTPIQHVVNAMWAHEEDAGLQMLACVALARHIRQDKSALLRIALPAVSAVVNAMKAHPNEVIVQEKASHVLQLLAKTDGQRELSFVASGAVAALVGALQAHVSDASVQEEACAALAAIVHAGGADRATIVASVSGLTALVNALAAHPDAVGVQREACRALASILPFGDAANLPHLGRDQTEPLLQAAASSFPVECGPLVEAILPHL